MQLPVIPWRLAAAVATLAILCPGGAVRGQTMPTIRVLSLPIDSGVEPYLAQQMGFFKKAGINVQIVGGETNGAAIAAAIASGAGDIGQSNVVSIATARQRNLPFVLVAPSKLFVARLHQNALVVAANSALRTARDLNGKTIAVSGLKNVSEIGVDAWLDQNGASLAAVKIVEMPFTAMPAAIAAGRVDAGVLPQPDLEEALSSKAVRVLAYPYESIAKQFLVGCWFATATWSKDHPDLVRAYASAMQETADWANRNPRQVAALVESLSKQPAKISALPEYAQRLDPRDIQPLIDASARYGALKSGFPAAELIATEHSDVRTK